MTGSDGAPGCPHCGAAYDREHRFCGRCGGRLPAASASASAADAAVGDAGRPAAGQTSRPAPPAAEPRPSSDRELDRIAGPRYGETPQPRPAPAGAANPAYYIAPNRVILLTALSTGLYLFYWMYLTWRHYRDYSGENAYPICHALTLLAPVYQVFRLHAHFRVYRELMDEWGVPSTLNPALAAALLVAAIALYVVAERLVADLLPVLLSLPDAVLPSMQERIGFFVVSAARVGIVAWLLWQAQGNLNRYWQRRIGMPLGTAPVSLVEIALVILGIIAWIRWTIILLNPELLAAAAADGGAE